jgi:hypothetical protein
MGNGALLGDIFPHRNLNKRVSLLDFVGQGRVLFVYEQKMSKCGSSPRPDTTSVSLALHNDVDETLLNRRNSTLNVGKSHPYHPR